MTEPFVVEVWGRPAGIVVRDGNVFRFHAMARPYFELDGARFTTPGHARLAAARLEFCRRDGDESHGSDAGRSLGKASHSESFCPL